MSASVPTDGVNSDKITPFPSEGVDYPPNVQFNHPSFSVWAVNQHGRREKLQSTQGGPVSSTHSTSPLGTDSEGARTSVLAVDYSEYGTQPQMVVHGGLSPSKRSPSAKFGLMSRSDRSLVPDVPVDQIDEKGMSPPAYNYR
jgi:hypothetical protein